MKRLLKASCDHRQNQAEKHRSAFAPQAPGFLLRATSLRVKLRRVERLRRDESA
jgi:hypothetical protein